MTYATGGHLYTHRVEVSDWSRGTLRRERLIGPRRGVRHAQDHELVRADTPEDEPPGWGGLAVDTHHTGPDKSRWWDTRHLALRQVVTGWECTHAGETHVRDVAASILDVLSRTRYVGAADADGADALIAAVQEERARKAAGEPCSLLLLDRVLDRLPAAELQRVAEALRGATAPVSVGTTTPDVAEAILALSDPVA